MASVGPLEAWWSKNARMSARRRHRVRPSWATSSQSGRYPASDRVDQPGHCSLTAAPVGIGVGGDDLLIDQPGELDGEVLVGVENAGEAGVLASREQLQAGAGDAPNPVERVAGMTTPAQGLLLDALAAGVELGAGQRHEVKRVMPISA